MDNNHREAMLLPQTQSPLFTLPGELRNYINDLAITPSTTIVNPSWNATVKRKHQQMPSLGVSLLRTCRAIYLEANESIILKRGDFIFTRIKHIQEFFARLSLAQASHIHQITIDLREAASDDSQSEESTKIANEWVHYFCCVRGAHMMGAWCADLSTLASDVPHLRALCIDLSNWQPRFAGSRIGGWRYLQRLLQKIRGLESLTLKGICLDSSSWGSQPVPWSLGLWFSPVFDKDETALIELMGQTTRAVQEKETKLVEWHDLHGIMQLTVGVADTMSILSTRATNCGSILAQDGSMLWNDFLKFKEDQTDSIKRREASLSSGNIWDGPHEVLV